MFPRVQSLAEGAGYGYVWLVPAAAALRVLVLTRAQVTGSRL